MGRLRITALLLVAVLLTGVLTACTGGGSGAESTAPTGLSVDGMAAPIGLDPHDVYFAWRLHDTDRGALQSSYRITVEGAATPQAGTTTVWDSGRVASGAHAFVAYQGHDLAPDTAYRWSVRTWSTRDGSGSAPSTGTFETGLRDVDWRADWVRRPADATREPDQYTYVRTERSLAPSPITRARAYVAADQQYELSVNGRRAGKGQAYSYPDAQYYETLDVTHLLRAGKKNAVAATYAWDGPTKGHPAGEPGVIVQIDVEHRDGTTERISTDGTWRVRRGAWQPGTQRDLEGDLVDFTEHIDGRAIPVGWEQPGFDDRGWAAATVVGPAGTPPYTHLVSARTRVVEHPIRPVSQKTLTDGSVVADFGKVYAAIPVVTLHHTTRGRVIRMHAGYLLDPDGQVSTTHGTQHTDMSYSYVEGGGASEEFHPFDYLGFRYFQLDGAGGDTGSPDISALARHTSLADEHAGTFSSSDKMLDAEFALGRHSALYSAQESFIDTPTREKGPWLWDGFNESVAAMDAFGEQNLTRKALVEYAQSQSRYWTSNGSINKIYPTGLGALDINEFTEIYPEWVWQYWLRTGDAALLPGVYPALRGVARYVESAVDPATGLVTSLPSTSIYYSFPTVTRLNVLGANVLRRVAEIGTALHRPASEVAALRSAQSALTSAINRRLTRADGTYVDGLDAAGNKVNTASQETNAASIVYGVAPPERVARIASYVAGLGMQAPPRTAAEVLEALAIARDDRAVVLSLTNTKADGWANILSRGATYTWEVWHPSDVIGDSMSHGWGANVLVEIQQALLGVRPAAPGFATFTVTPPTDTESAGLSSASGRVPTPSGAIAVHWKRSHGVLTLELTVPPDTRAEVVLYGGGARGIRESGQPLSAVKGIVRVSARGAATTIVVGAGAYRFTQRTPS